MASKYLVSLLSLVVSTIKPLADQQGGNAKSSQMAQLVSQLEVQADGPTAVQFGQLQTQVAAQAQQIQGLEAALAALTTPAAAGSPIPTGPPEHVTT